MKGLLLVLMAALLVGCATGGPRRSAPDGPPLQAPANLAHLPDPVPRVEPKSRRGNPPSYVVHGRTYFVMPTAEGYSEVGHASWYGRKFHGRTTSSGEPFDMLKLTAAHRSLPIPAYVRVTNLENGRKTIVRVNDRGPFHPNRIIDLSYAAAVKLGFHNAGTARVKVEVIGPSKSYMLQAGAFSSLAAADQLKARLLAFVDAPAHVVRTPGDALYRVRIGPVNGEDEARRLQSELEARELGRALLLEH